jgi:hypothetical protein
MSKYKRIIEISLNIILIAVLIIFSSSCYVTNVRFQQTQNSQNLEAQGHKILAQSVNFASVGLGIYPISRPVHPVCSQGQILDYVAFEMDLLDSVLHFVIGGIYTSRKVRVYCK